MEYFKRDPSGVPHEIQQIMARKLFANLEPKGTDDALGHAKGNQHGADSGGDSHPDCGNRMRHVVSVINKLFAELDE